MPKGTASKLSLSSLQVGVHKLLVWGHGQTDEIHFQILSFPTDSVKLDLPATGIRKVLLPIFPSSLSQQPFSQQDKGLPYPKSYYDVS